MMDFKVVFVNKKTAKQISKNNYKYEEVMNMLNAGKVILNDGEKIEMYLIIDKVYNINKKGFAIFLEETTFN